MLGAFFLVNRHISNRARWERILLVFAEKPSHLTRCEGRYSTSYSRRQGLISFSLFFYVSCCIVPQLTVTDAYERHTLIMLSILVEYSRGRSSLEGPHHVRCPRVVCVLVKIFSSRNILVYGRGDI